MTDTKQEVERLLRKAIEAGGRIMVHSDSVVLTLTDAEKVLALLAPTESPEPECTGWIASWCPVHGDCVGCERADDGDWLSHDPQCPLHGHEKGHAVPPVPPESPEPVEVGPDDPWPEAITDGLSMACSRCGEKPSFDYGVTHDFWAAVVPKNERPGVVCLPCLGRLAPDRVGEHLLFVQWVGPRGETVELLPSRIFHYAPPKERHHGISLRDYAWTEVARALGLRDVVKCSQSEPVVLSRNLTGPDPTQPESEPTCECGHTQPDCECESFQPDPRGWRTRLADRLDNGEATPQDIAQAARTLRFHDSRQPESEPDRATCDCGKRHVRIEVDGVRVLGCPSCMKTSKMRLAINAVREAVYAQEAERARQPESGEPEDSGDMCQCGHRKGDHHDSLAYCLGNLPKACSCHGFARQTYIGDAVRTHDPERSKSGEQELPEFDGIADGDMGYYRAGVHQVLQQGLGVEDDAIRGRFVEAIHDIYRPLASPPTSPPSPEPVEALREIVTAYDEYRGRGLDAHTGEYQRVVAAIEAARPLTQEKP